MYYVVAMFIAFAEFFLLHYYWDPYEILPTILTFPLMALGAIMILMGHIFRIGAEFTAGSNFNHKI